jgi:hypothetical protein
VSANPQLLQLLMAALAQQQPQQNPMLAQLQQQQAAAQAAGPAAAVPHGPMAWEAHLLPQFSNLGASRPLGPGEYLQNPQGGGWASEMTYTLQDPRLNNGQYTVVPGLWIVDGKPTHLTEDEAMDMAVKSGLGFPHSFPTEQAAEAFANQRESVWEKTPMGRSDAQPPLWAQPKPKTP